MPINLDFVGLNTLVNEPITSSTNTIGVLDTQHVIRQALFNGAGSGATAEALYNESVSNYAGAEALSVSFWINLSSISRTYRTILQTRNNTAKKDVFYLAFQNDLLQITLHNSYGSGQQLTWETNITADTFFNKWSHVVITTEADISSAPKVYINGVLSATATLHPSSVSVSLGNTQKRDITQIYLFQLNSSSPINTLAGALSEFAIYNTSLTEAQIAQIYNGGEYIDLTTLSFNANIKDYWHL